MKAIALISGGLDSTLAAKLMQNLGLELVCLNTVSPFCLCNQHSSNGCLHGASHVAKDLGLKLLSINVAEEILQIVKKPKHGYGSNMNPCIDCRILLLKKAKEAFAKEGAAFIITGEVLGQRPMSQKLKTMRLIEQESGLEGLVLRPLSAKVLEPTIPEQKGWIERDKLLAINGRSRREQFTLAREYGINDYPCPSGGCLLTDPEFSKRLKDLMSHNEFNINNVLLLKVGRHFRLTENSKLVVGRNEKENQQLEYLAKENDYLFFPPEDLAGPTALGRGIFNEDLINLSLRIICRYFDSKDTANIVYRRMPGGEKRVAGISPLKEEELVALRV